MKRVSKTGKREKNIPEKQKVKTSKKTVIAEKKNLIYDYIEKYPFIVFLFLFSVISIFVFKDFLFLKKLYLFKDIGSDTINTFYPNRYLSTLANEQGLSYTFRNGMGEAVTSGNNNFFQYVINFFTTPHLFWTNFVSSKDIHKLMFYEQFCNIFFAGIIFFFYLRTLKLSKYVQVLGSILFSFSGIMIIGSCWYHHTGEILRLVILLLAFELYYKKNIWFVLPIIIALFTSVGFWYYNAIFFIVYILFRYFDENDFSLKNFSKYIGKLSLLGVIGILVTLPFFYKEIINVLNMPRVSGTTSKISEMQEISIFATGGFLHNITALLRFYSNDILGTGNIDVSFINGQKILTPDFKGYNNYYEAPMFYIGLSTLIVFPQIFTSINKRKKITYTILMCLWLMPVIFPYFRRAYYLFFGDYYRTFSFFLPFILLLYSSKKISNIKSINVFLLIGTFLFLTIILHFNFFNTERLLNNNLSQSPIKNNIQAVVTIFLILYLAVLLLIKYKPQFKKATLVVLLLLAVAEVTYTSNTTINNRSVLNLKEFRSKTNFNDYSTDAISFIKSKDKSFYRIEKDFASGAAVHSSLNDAMVQGYFGTARYSSHQGIHYTNYISQLGLSKKGEETSMRWSNGLRYSPIPLITMNNKYYLSKSLKPDFMRFAYDSIGQTGDVKILKNRLYLPFGYSYNKFLPKSTFDSLDIQTKPFVMLESAVIEDSLIENVDKYLMQIPKPDTLYNKIGFNEISAFRDSLLSDTLSLTQWREDYFKGTIQLTKPKLMFFSILRDEGWKLKINNKDAKLLPVNIGFMGVLLEKGKHEIELEYKVEHNADYRSIVMFLFIILMLSAYFYLSKKSIQFLPKKL